MNVLQVIHGYPPRYNAGSEVYTQTLANGLQQAGVEVAVFCREEDPFLPDYHLREETDPLNSDIPVFLVNHARSNARFRNRNLEKTFQIVLEKVQPDVIHFGHLSHLSTGLIEVAKAHGAPVVFTLHDFWLMCPRGQFLQWGLSAEEPWQLCDGQEDSKCAERCFNRFVTGLDDDPGQAYWTQWVADRMLHCREMSELVDLFLAPSRHLMNRHVEEFNLDPKKVVYLDYGFDRQRLSGRKREPEDAYVFGYIGRHHPSKGIHHLVEAYNQVIGDVELRIWGRPEGQLTASVKTKCDTIERGTAHDVRNRITSDLMPEEANTTPTNSHKLSDNFATNHKKNPQKNNTVGDSIPHRGIGFNTEYHNKNVVRDVFNHCDCIVVPSIWDENSPLVIHEAQQAGVPVITADHGGMGEYVKDMKNGRTHVHRSVESLRRAMQWAADNPQEMAKLGRRGYLYSKDGQVPSIEKHVEEIIGYYKDLGVRSDDGGER